MSRRATIARSVTIEGVGLHSGNNICLTLQPAAVGTGIVFVRSDRDNAEVPATLDHLARVSYATTIARNGIAVGTVEHLLSAALALGIDDLRVHLDGEEVPIIDGSASPFVSMLADAGRVESDAPRLIYRVRRALTVRDGERWMRIEPGRGLQVRYTIDFDDAVIGHSERRFSLDPRAYARDIAPARTFCRVDEVDTLRAAGLAQGGSLDNAVVVGPGGLLNPPLRFRDEFVRHKILDLVGDLALLGAPVCGRITAVRAGHALHTRLMSALLEESSAWTLETDEAPVVPAGVAAAAAAPA